MLELRDIKKSYRVGDTVTEALKGISIDFRESEFVAILGQSAFERDRRLGSIRFGRPYDKRQIDQGI